MASGVRALTGATFGVATTGVAGTDRARRGKPPRRCSSASPALAWSRPVALEALGQTGSGAGRAVRRRWRPSSQVPRREETTLG